jgi:hypothetical protein
MTRVCLRSIGLSISKYHPVSHAARGQSRCLSTITFGSSRVSRCILRQTRLPFIGYRNLIAAAGIGPETLASYTGEGSLRRPQKNGKRVANYFFKARARKKPEDFYSKTQKLSRQTVQQLNCRTVCRKSCSN